MSINVPAGLLAAEAAKYDFAYLLTVSKEATPRLVAVSFTVAPNGSLVRLPDVGNSALTNVAIRKQATILFPPTSHADHSLVVDGAATADLQDGSVTVTPAKCTLHRPAPPRPATSQGVGRSGTQAAPALGTPGPGGAGPGSQGPAGVLPPGTPATPTSDAVPSPAATQGAPSQGAGYQGAAFQGATPTQDAVPSAVQSPGSGATAGGATAGGATPGDTSAGGSVEDRLAALRNRAEREDLAHVEKSTLEHMADLTGKGLTSKYDLNQPQFTEVTSAPGSNTTAKPWDYPVRPGQQPAVPTPGGVGASPSDGAAALAPGDADDTIIDAEIVEDDPPSR